MDINIVISVGFGIIGVIAFIFALKQSKKAKNAENKIIELEQAMTSYKYLKDKALSYYYNGNYEESLDIFKKYLLNNKDDKEWSRIILEIIVKETEKIYSGFILVTQGKMPEVSLLTHAYILNENHFAKSSPYPEIIKSLINDYYNVFNKKRPVSEFLIALFDKDWQKAKNLITGFIMLEDTDLDALFKQYVIKYLDLKLGITDETFFDDVPF